MGEIKFRAQAQFDHRWVYGNLVFQKGTPLTPDYAEILEFEGIESGEYLFNSVDVKAYTIGQYTGMNDINGDEIYEGDIVSKTAWNGGEEYELSGVVEWHKDGYVLKSLADQCKYGMSIGDNCNLSKGEVTGNIHDNPELLQ